MRISPIINDDKIDGGKLYNRTVLKSVPRYSNISLIKDISDDNEEGARCYNFVFGDDVHDLDDAENILYNDYREIPIKQVKKGDIVLFFNKDWNSEHIAIVEESNGTLKGIRIISKWGLEGIFKTDLKMLPTSYGKHVRFWRKMKKTMYQKIMDMDLTSK